MGTESIGIEKSWLRFIKYIDGNIMLQILVDSKTSLSVYEMVPGYEFKIGQHLISEQVLEYAVDLYLYVLAETGCSNFIIKLQPYCKYNVKIWHEIWEII